MQAKRSPANSTEGQFQSECRFKVEAVVVAIGFKNVSPPDGSHSRASGLDIDPLRRVG